MRITGLHRVPFDSERFAAEVAPYVGDSHEAQWRNQFRANWDNAWLITVEHDAEIDFDRFCERPDDQAPWLEQLLESQAGINRGAFFLHYLDPTRPLKYAGHELPLPTPTPAPAELLSRMAYQSPD